MMIDWLPIPKAFWGGQLQGYRIKYKEFGKTVFMHKVIHPGYQASTLTELKPYTKYWVEVNGFNSAGDGPPEYTVATTLEAGNSILFNF